MDENTRAIRQRDLVLPAALGNYTALVVGVGAIGRQVAVQLAAMGASPMILFDDDVVAIENLAVQGYREKDLGLSKVEAAGEVCRELNAPIQLHLHPQRFRRSSHATIDQLILPTQRLAVFCCVDSMASRRLVWESLRQRAAFFVDGRMAGEVLRVLSSSQPPSELHYPKTLFEDAQAHPAPCTARSTLCAASIAAGLMLSRFARQLRAVDAGGDLLLSLSADELTVGAEIGCS